MSLLPGPLVDRLLNIQYFPKSRLLVSMTQHTVESRFYEPPRETRIRSKNRRVREIGGKIILFEKRLLVRN